MHLDAITLQQDLKEAKGDPGAMAQAICKAVETASVGELATKADLAATSADVAATRVDLAATRADLAATRTELAATSADVAATRADLATTRAELQADMAALEVRLIKWVVATNAAGVLALAGLIAALI